MSPLRSGCGSRGPPPESVVNFKLGHKYQSPPTWIWWRVQLVNAYYCQVPSQPSLNVGLLLIKAHHRLKVTTEHDMLCVPSKRPGAWELRLSIQTHCRVLAHYVWTSSRQQLATLQVPAFSRSLSCCNRSRFLLNHLKLTWARIPRC